MHLCSGADMLDLLQCISALNFSASNLLLELGKILCGEARWWSNFCHFLFIYFILFGVCV